MATLLHSDPRRLSSWWWDTHIIPNNSKWMHHNLTEMDTKVRAMINILNEDGDSFATRAEMYYKKRPELMKLVEDFYGAYRALAERYDQLTRELRLAHRAIPSRASVSPITPRDFGLSRKGLKQLIDMFQTEDERLIYKDSDSECSCLSSSYENMSFKDAERGHREMDHENISFNDIKEKFDADDRRQAEQDDALERQIHRLNEEMEDLHKDYQDLLQQLESAGIDPRCVRLSIEDLRDTNSRLEQFYSEEKAEKEALLMKLEVMEERSSILESYLSDVHIELESSKDKIKAIQESCDSLCGENLSLVAEKSALLCQLQIAGDNNQKLLEKNGLLEDSLCSASTELEALRVKSKLLDDLCRTLDDEKSRLQCERSSLICQLEFLGKKVERVETRFTELEDTYANLKEGEFARDQVDGACLLLSSEARLSTLEDRIHHLQQKLRKAVNDLLESRDETQQLQIQCDVLSAVIRQLSSDISEYEVRKEADRCLQDNLQQKLRKDSEDELGKAVNDLSESRDETQQLQIQCAILSALIRQLSSDISEYEARKEVQEHQKEANRCLQDKLSKDEEQKSNLEHQKKENASLREANESLEAQVDLLHEEIEAGKIRELVINSELDERSCDLRHWEDMAVSYGFDLQMSAVHEVLFTGKVHELSTENTQLKSQAAAYFPVIRTLKDRIAPLEQNAVLSTKLHSTDSSKAQEITVGKRSCSVHDGISELLDLQNRIEIVDKALVEERLSKPDAAMKEMESCWSGPGTPDLGNETQMKDILLDSVYGPVKKGSLQHQFEIADYTDVDAVEFAKEVTEVNDEGSGKIILERLSSDAQELERLDLSVQELKEKMKKNRKCNSEKAVEYTRLSGQLQDVDDTIAQLVDVNTKLMKEIMESPSSGTVDSMELVKAEQAEKRKVARQASKEGERIGRLQLDVQKINNLFLKLEEEKNENNKGKSSPLGSRTRVILSDFLYSNGRSRSRKQRKVHICGCDSADASDPLIRKFVKSKSMQNAKNLLSPLMR